MDLGTGSHWRIKGEGNANFVFEYCGPNAYLVGSILRVRKPAPAIKQSKALRNMPGLDAVFKLEHELWTAALQLDADSGNEECDLAYIRDYLAPLLGRDVVFAGAPCPLPEGLLSAPAASAANGSVPTRPGIGSSAPSSRVGLLLPDHTMFASVPEGYQPAGPVVCVEIKPKSGARFRRHPHHPQQQPQQQQQAEAQPPAVTTPAAAAAAAAATSKAEATSKIASVSSSDDDEGEFEGGPEALCRQSAQERFEVLPVHQRYPRFVLHMLLKHVQSGQPLSGYNPRDLFSCEPPRMLRALTELLLVPSNNLRIFRDGKLIYGGRPLHGAISNESSAYNSNSTLPLPALECRLSGDLGLSDGSSGADLGLGASIASGDLGHAGSSGAGQAAATAAAPAQQQAEEQKQQQQQSNQQDGNPHGDAQGGGNGSSMAAVDKSAPHVAGRALMRLVAKALTVSGVLPRLLEVQSMDPLGVETAAGLLRDLLHSDRIRSGRTSDDGGGRSSADGRSGASSEDGSGGSGAVNTVAALASDPALRLAALQQLARYLTSATAKDCGIMVTLQRVTPTPGGHDAAAAAAGSGGADSGNAAPTAAVMNVQQPVVHLISDDDNELLGGACSATHWPQPDNTTPTPSTTTAATTTAATQDGGGLNVYVSSLQPASAGSETVRQGTRLYVAKVAFVDLDRKPLAKVPVHLSLERQIEACARDHAELLAKWQADVEARQRSAAEAEAVAVAKARSRATSASDAGECWDAGAAVASAVGALAL